MLAEAILLAVFAWLPVMGGERAFFGVRVDPQTLHGEGRRTLRRYRLTLVASFVLFCALFFAPAWFWHPALAVAAFLASGAAAFLIYGAYARRLRPLAL